MSKTISITLGALVQAAQILGELRDVKKKPRHAFDIALYVSKSIQPALNSYDEAKKAIIIAADESGSITSEHPEYDNVVAQLDELVQSRVDVLPFPVELEALVTGMESFDNNAASEGVFYGLMTLVDGSPEETVH